jgi:nitrate/nitrite transporter NarK
MFELYSAWTWIPTFVVMSAAASGMPAGPNREALAALVAFCAIAIGGLGCVWGGIVADRRGREWLVTVAMAASGACASDWLHLRQNSLAARAGVIDLGFFRYRRFGPV